MQDLKVQGKGSCEAIRSQGPSVPMGMGNQANQVCESKIVDIKE